MNDREYPKAVQKQLEQEGFYNIRKFSRNRFYATAPGGKTYDVRVKYCIKPRKLYAIDVGYMTGLTREDVPSILITNGTDITKKTREYLESKGMCIILNWYPGSDISNKLRDVSK